METERREQGRRAEVVRAVVAHIVQSPAGSITLQSLQESLHIPPDAARRIIARLVDAGIIVEVQRGVWARSPELPPATGLGS